MRKNPLTMLCCLGFANFGGALTSGFAQGVSTVPEGQLGQTYQWSLAFEDNFSAASVDSAKWAPSIYWGITSNGSFENLSNLEWYFPANRTVANGILTIQARKETTVNSYGTFPYTSGMITSDRTTDTTAVPAKFDFLYGYAEIRAKVPAGKGLWPAFWMLPSDHSSSEEIDIMEILGDRPDISYMTYHWGSSQSTGQSWTIAGTDFSRGYHTFAVDWSAEAIVWYIDGVERQRITDTSIISHKAMFLLANLQVGGSWAGNPNANTVFPANYNIDYIRVWKKGAPIPPASIAPAFTTQPLSQAVTTGTSVTFTAAASGTPAPTFQWKKDNVSIGGATNNSYTIASAVLGDEGSYTVVATNSADSTASNAAILAVGVPPAGFDAAGYLARNPSVAALYGADAYAAWIHFRDVGVYLGEVFDDSFRVEEYLALYPDLFALFGGNLGGALEHWLSQGRTEGRLGRVPLEFDAAGYFARNPDVALAYHNNPVGAWQHFWAYGIYEGRAYDDDFRAFEYLAINADLTAVFVNDWRQATLHWMRYGRTEGRLGRIPLIFDATEYLNRYPDVGATWGTYPTTVWLHFWLYGIDEARNFDDLFRVDEYLALNPDLVAVFGTNRRGAFTHWVRYGRAEGRASRNP